MRAVARIVGIVVGLAGATHASPLLAQVQMPNPKEISGVPLPVGDVPVGSVSVRVVRGSFDKNIPDLPVEFDVDGQKQTKQTDATGRVLFSGLKPGARVRALTVVDGKTIESQTTTIAASGIRFVLVADDPDIARREAEDRALATATAVKGIVVFGPESRVVAQLSEDTLHIFYVVEILNTARTPVDIGGPVILDLPRAARGAALNEGTKQATVAGRRVTVVGPFAPGSTTLQIAFELPYGGDTARIEQPLPVALQQVNVIVAQSGNMDVRSAQVASKRRVNDRGQDLVVGSGPALPPGETLVLEITGLPHYARWPRYLALTLAGAIMSLGIWAAVFNTPRRRAA